MFSYRSIGKHQNDTLDNNDNLERRTDFRAEVLFV